MSVTNDWVSIASAAAEAGLPVRTIYNWVRSGSIESRKEGAGTLVRLEEVRAKADERAGVNVKPPMLPAPAAGADLPAPDAGMSAARCLELLPSDARYTLAPELLAYLIRLFKQGEELPAIVERLRLAPELVVEARRQYELLASAGDHPGLVQRMTKMEQRLETRLAEFEARLQAVERRQAGLPQVLLQDVLAIIGCRKDDFNQRLAELALSREDCLRLIDDGTARLHDAYNKLADTVLRSLRDRQ